MGMIKNFVNKVHEEIQFHKTLKRLSKYQLSYRGEKMEEYCKQILSDDYDHIESYDDVLYNFRNQIGCKTIKEAALTYLIVCACTKEQ